MLIALPLQQFL